MGNQARHVDLFFQAQILAHFDQLRAQLPESHDFAAASGQGQAEIQAAFPEDAAGSQQHVKALGHVETTQSKQAHGALFQARRFPRAAPGTGGRGVHGGRRQSQAVVDQGYLASGLAAVKGFDAGLVRRVVGAHKKGRAQLVRQVRVRWFQIVAAR